MWPPWPPWKREGSTRSVRLTRAGGRVSSGWLGVFGLPRAEGCACAPGIVSAVRAGPLVWWVVEDGAAGLLGVQQAVAFPLVLEGGTEKSAESEARCRKEHVLCSKPCDRRRCTFHLWRPGVTGQLFAGLIYLGRLLFKSCWVELTFHNIYIVYIFNYLLYLNIKKNHPKCHCWLQIDQQN